MEIAAQIARGLAAAHERGVVHRDLTPENVMVNRDGQAKVLDFGLAKWTASGGPGPGGTPPLPSDGLNDSRDGGENGGYMSPEQVQGLAVDHRSDRFALGVIPFEMLAGRTAFSGSSPTVTMSSILVDEPPDLATLRGDLPPALPRIVPRCLEKRPERRFRSAGDVSWLDLSPAGRWVAAGQASAASPLILLPTGAGEPRRIPVGRINLESAAFFPSGEELLLVGAEPGRRTRLYRLALSGDSPRPISPESVAPRRVPRVPITRLSVPSGAREPWRELLPTDSPGFGRVRDRCRRSRRSTVRPGPASPIRGGTAPRPGLRPPAGSPRAPRSRRGR